MNYEQLIDQVVRWLDGVDLTSVDQRVDEMQRMSQSKDASLTSLKEATRAEMLRASRHESSHAVIACRMSVPVQWVRIRPDATGAAQYDTTALSEGDELGLAVTALAAPFCELLHGTDAARQFHLAHSADILQGSRSAERSRERLPQLTNEVIARTSCACVLSNLDVIDRVAIALMYCGELDGATIAALCGKRH